MSAVNLFHMQSLFSRSAFFFGSALVLASCSYLNEQNENLNLPEPELSTTGMGAATGAAFGAGLGVIVGSATGNAGEGLVIGSLAGAAAGGVVGNQLEQQETAAERQGEMLNRHEERIQNQEREMEELKRNRDSHIPARTSSRRADTPAIRPAEVASKGNQGALRPDTFAGDTRSPARAPDARAELKRPIASPVSKAEVPVYARQGSKVQTPESVAQAKVQSVEVKPEKEPIRLAKMEQPVKEAKVAASAAAGSDLPKAVTETRTMEDKSAMKPAQVSPSEQKFLNGLPPAAKPVVKPENAPANTAPPEGLGADCEKAESEAKRARSSSSQADKLFYLRRALRLCSTEARYHTEIATVYMDIGRDEDAEFEFRQALDLDPNNKAAIDQLSKLDKKKN